MRLYKNCDELIKRLEFCSSLFGSVSEEGIKSNCCSEILKTLNKSYSNQKHHQEYIKDMVTWLNGY
jgi:antitoxin component HigA of HigAB toxin-antitoxin module